MKKILCLIIDCQPVDDWRVTYEVHRDIWNKWLDRHPDVEGYFLYADPDLASEYATNGRNFTVRVEERVDTILTKTQKAIDVLLKDHEYVIRTNISSLYDFRLLQRRNPGVNDLYAGHLWPMNSTDHQGVVGDGLYVAGSAILLSNETARKLLTPVPNVNLNPWDDIAIAQILKEQGIFPTSDPWFCFDYAKGMDQIVVGQHTHYRLRDVSDPQRIQERRVKEHIFNELCRLSSYPEVELPIYCIHVTEAVDRKRHLEAQFRHIGASRVIVVEALTPSSPEVVDHYGAGFRRDFPHWATTVSCFASHLKALRTFVEGSTDSYAIICEDDVCFRKDFAKALRRVWDNMPEGCPLVALSYWHQRSELAPTTWAGRDPSQKNLAPIGTTAGALLYLISRKWAIEALERFDRPLKDIVAPMKTSEAITLASGGLLAHPPLAVEKPNNTSLIVTNDARHEAKHTAFYRRWGFENFFVDARYVFDPAQGSSSIVTGFPAVILRQPAEDLGKYRQSGEHVIVPGQYERDLVDWAKQLATKDKQFIDCGAHMGSWTLVMAAHFREVHAFEPQRLIFQQLCGNVALNGLENVFAHNVGLDEKPGKLELHRSGFDRGTSTARQDAVAAFRLGGDGSSMETVPVATLDSFADVLTDVGLVKIDVEGLELRVIKGAVEVLKQNGLPKLMIECWSHSWYRQDKEALIDFLSGIGYGVIPIRGYPDMLLAGS